MKKLFLVLSLISLNLRADLNYQFKELQGDWAFRSMDRRLDIIKFVPQTKTILKKITCDGPTYYKFQTCKVKKIYPYVYASGLDGFYGNEGWSCGAFYQVSEFNPSILLISEDPSCASGGSIEHIKIGNIDYVDSGEITE